MKKIYVYLAITLFAISHSHDSCKASPKRKNGQTVSTKGKQKSKSDNKLATVIFAGICGIVILYIGCDYFFKKSEEKNPNDTENSEKKIEKTSQQQQSSEEKKQKEIEKTSQQQQSSEETDDTEQEENSDELKQEEKKQEKKQEKIEKPLQKQQNSDELKQEEKKPDDTEQEEKEQKENEKSLKQQQKEFIELADKSIDKVAKKKDLLKEYKTKILEYLAQENYTKKKLQGIIKKNFLKNIVAYCDNNKKLNGPLTKLYNKMQEKPKDEQEGN